VWGYFNEKEERGFSSFSIDPLRDFGPSQASALFHDYYCMLKKGFSI
jgi:hypothetical protein